MKRLFSKNTPKPPSQNKITPPSAASTSVHSIGLQPRDTIPAVPHPRPYDHIAILPTKDGLLLKPHYADDTSTEAHVRISWTKEAKIEEVTGDGVNADTPWADAVIVYGLVGVLELYTASYLLVVTRISEVGHLFEKSHAIYSVQGVTSIPLVEDRASAVIRSLATRNAAEARVSLLAPVRSDIDPRQDSQSIDEEVKASDSKQTPKVKFVDVESTNASSASLAQSLSIQDRPSSPASSLASTQPSDQSAEASPVIKTLAERLSFWQMLSKRAPVAPPATEDSQTTVLNEQDLLDSTPADGQEPPEEVLTEILSHAAPPPATVEERHKQIEAKVLRECIKEFAKNEMYFAYNFDMTRSLQHKQDQIAQARKRDSLLADLQALDESKRPRPQEQIDVLAEPSPTLPLWRRVDRQFWWNEWLSKPFIDAGLHSYVLPIIQGYFQFTKIPLSQESGSHGSEDTTMTDYIIMSRRSRDRAGLRYQRRGIDDDAHVANFVETEVIWRVEREHVSNVFSYVQIRGSIPLFWTQSGYSLKPPPTLSPERTHEQNANAMKRHFRNTLPAYGPHTIVNLAEQHGKEAVVTNAYHDYIQEMALPDVQYCEYDFHAETKGMKYENISKLLDQLERTFDSQGFFWVADQVVLSRQKGVFRVNCIDCLDRTNVVQSAFARHVLTRQLLAVALLHPEKHDDLDLIFNDVWANNGDAISRAYAGTSALKGDFTRTGKRDLGGLLNDGMNSLARMYTSTFSDWFSQAVIDYMLGYRTIAVFSEFLTKLQSTDPRELIRLSNIRAEAIATSVSRVLEDGERLLSGWTVFAPTELNVKIGQKFEEKVLLLSYKALYIISYDYTLEKVSMYTRVPLEDITSISKGAYILSPLEEASCDPVENAGFIVRWRNSHQVTRITSYCVRNSLDIEDFDAETQPSTPTPISANLPSEPTPAPAASRRPAPVAASSTKRQSYAPGLARVFSRAAPLPATSDISFAAFKALPVDPARSRRGNGSAFSEPADDLTGAETCRDVVAMMVDAIRRACEDAGGATSDEFVKEEDIVSRAEAQRMTSVYAKMEYGLKRLLWLGG